MSKVFTLLALFILGFVGGWYLNTHRTQIDQFLTYYPCKTPIAYKIGRIDPQFHLTQEEFADDVDQAAKVWEKKWGSQLFRYDPQAELSVSLIFDGRQAQNSQISTLEKKLKGDDQKLTPQLAQYQQLSADFKQKLANFNTEVASWNQKGGAPADVYSKLFAEQEDLKKQATQLNNMGTALRQSTYDFNTQVSQLNQKITVFNDELQLKPEEGKYDPNVDTIEVYLAPNQHEVIHTLAHELGHARGLEHVLSSTAIMYAYTSQAITPSSEDMAALTEVCQPQSLVKKELDMFSTVLQRLRHPTQLSK